MTDSTVSRKVYCADSLDSLVDRVDPAEKRLLDVGFGGASNARVLRDRGHELCGLTMSFGEAALARDVFSRIIVTDIEAEFPAFAHGSFDAVVFSHVLEHLRDPWSVLMGARLLVRPRGSIYVVLPNASSLGCRIRWLRGDLRYQDAGVMDRTHLRFFNYYTASDLIEQAGYEIVERWVDGHVPLGPIRALAPRLARAIDARGCDLFPNLFGVHLLFRARPALSDPAE